jgi:hypothetical protein
VRFTDVHFWLDDFKESEHPRGQPENAGQFTKGGGGTSSSIKPGNYVKTKGGASFNVRKVEGGKAFPVSGRGVPLSEIVKYREKPGEGEWITLGEEQPSEPKTETKPPPELEKEPEPHEETGQEEVGSAGKLSDEAFQQKYGFRIGGNGANKSKVKEAIGLLPPNILSAVRNTHVTISSIPSHPKGSQGAYSNETNSIVIADTMGIRGTAQKIKDPVGTTIHEIGHALDAKSEHRLSAKIRSIVEREFSKLSIADQYLAKYYISNEREMWAESFRATFSSKGAFGMGKKGAERLFPEAIAFVRNSFGG